MDLDKIKALLDYMGRSRVQEMRVTQDGTTVVIRNAPLRASATMCSPTKSSSTATCLDNDPKNTVVETKTIVRAPAPGIVHQAARPVLRLSRRLVPRWKLGMASAFLRR